MRYKVELTKDSIKGLRKLPRTASLRLAKLLDDIADKGVERFEYPNYSKLGDNRYHCHLGYGWVACWRWKDIMLVVEVYYVGSRESAPY